MDPFRPPTYNQYRPPYERQSFISPANQSYVHQQSTRPNYIRPNYRPNYGHMQISGNTGHMAATPGSEVEKLTTLFIGGISAGVIDDWMEKILKTCGTLKSWKRVKDQSGNPKGFGFAEYTDADSVLRALRVLGGDDKKDKGVILPALEEGATKKKLIVKVDENTRKYLDQYEASRPRTVHDTELDKNALLAVINVVEEMTKPPQEIAFFRERAAARERERQREEEERSNRRAKAEQSKERSSHDREHRENKERSYHNQPINFVPAKESRREERRWQHREEIIAGNRERDSERELNIREKQIRDRELMARKLSELDDDIEAETGQEEYYRDRSRWWFHRQQYRTRELAMDEQDRQKEQQEIEAEKRRLEWEHTIEEEKRQQIKAMEAEEISKKDSSLIAASSVSQNNNIKAKLTLNISSKRLLVPLEYSDDDDDDEKKNEERRKKIKDLVEIIPTNKEGLWKWNVKWEELDEAIIDKKLKPFVSKKIVEYLGVQEDELVSFVMDHLRSKKSASQLIKEMEMTLDEESELFVMKLWRMLIFETESKSKNF
ncbi:23719_t:CDS:10 [Entrophospora sp. SA101]|nr:699_t:CDS:10 [Entrophospora sp. SA101]CAJ0768279.1 23719_t:CDS:10 [Entrophospora sp. SA101]CAJ0831319.1 6194_t:CDS:10 [Entrophospora sp. SA101]CAJ0867113.1 4730_t:CDS:10 [Entrophospora sp. SA101]